MCRVGCAHQAQAVVVGTAHLTIFSMPLGSSGCNAGRNRIPVSLVNPGSPPRRNSVSYFGLRCFGRIPPAIRFVPRRKNEKSRRVRTPCGIRPRRLTRQRAPQAQSGCSLPSHPTTSHQLPGGVPLTVTTTPPLDHCTARGGESKWVRDKARTGVRPHRGAGSAGFGRPCPPS